MHIDEKILPAEIVGYNQDAKVLHLTHDAWKQDFDDWLVFTVTGLPPSIGHDEDRT